VRFSVTPVEMRSCSVTTTGTWGGGGKGGDGKGRIHQVLVSSTYGRKVRMCCQVSRPLAAVSYHCSHTAWHADLASMLTPMHNAHMPCQPGVPIHLSVLWRLNAFHGCGRVSE
jgi:hypothetical protein